LLGAIVVPWIKLDDQFIDHPKIVGLSNAAFRLWLAGLSYSARHLTDGAIPAPGVRTLTSIRYPLKASRELLDAGLWELNEGVYWIHDYLDYQPSKAETLSIREKRSDAGSRGGRASAQAKRKQVACDSSQAKSNPEPEPEPEPVLASTSTAGGLKKITLTGDHDPWKLGDPIEAPHDLVSLAESQNWAGTGLTGTARGLGEKILADGGPVESWEYQEAISELKRQSNPINPGLLGSVILRRRQEAAAAKNGAPAPARGKPQPGRGWEPYQEPEDDQ
jgi:hypothetical protein